MSLARFKSIATWLAEAKFVWLALFVNLAALVIAIRSGATEPAFRLVGLGLQVLGIASVIWGIAETRALFGHSPLLMRASNWLERFPLRTKNVTLSVSGVASSTSVGSVRGHVTYSPVGEPTPEARIEALEKNVTAIHDRISGVQKDIDAGRSSVSEALTSEAKSRQAEDENIRRQLEAMGTGGIHISAIGASWLFVGVVLSTASTELAAMLK